MKVLEKILANAKPHFEKDGRFKRLYPLFEAGETFLLSPSTLTVEGPHVRDALDMKRLMSIVVLAVLPCLLFGTYNTGLQALTAAGRSPGALACVLTGLRHVLPIVLVSYAVGGLWEVLFALLRKHEINEGFFVTGILFPLTLPPDIPLWLVAVGISFGVVLGKEVFGGTGMNILNPALAARAFVFFAYPAHISGDKVWVAIDGYSGATPLSAAAAAVGPDALTAVREAGFTLHDAVLGTIPGAIGETSALACLIGAAVLILSGIGSWRIMLSSVLGAAALSSLTAAAAGPESASIMSLPVLWQLSLGGFLFGTVFMATDPVSAASTRAGEWVYGFMIGALCLLVRTLNPAYPEGMMLAVLFMNVFAPLIDYVVLRIHFERRGRRRRARA